jgi:hypothetical protein
MSGPSTATTLVGSIASTVAERRSSSNSASSPKMSPGPYFASATGANDVTGVARVALAKYDLARLERARDGEVGDPLEVLALERREHRHTREQLDHIR